MAWTLPSTPRRFSIQARTLTRRKWVRRVWYTHWICGDRLSKGHLVVSSRFPLVTSGPREAPKVVGSFAKVMFWIFIAPCQQGSIAPQSNWGRQQMYLLLFLFLVPESMFYQIVIKTFLLVHWYFVISLLSRTIEHERTLVLRFRCNWFTQCPYCAHESTEWQWRVTQGVLRWPFCS